MCLVYGYISGTFGHRAFVSFGVSTLNSRTRRHVMYWTPPRSSSSQIKYTMGGSFVSNKIFTYMMSQHLCPFWRVGR